MKLKLSLSFIIATLLVFTISSCSKTNNEVSQNVIDEVPQIIIDEVSQTVIEDIDSIGTVDLDDEELINKIERIYSTLTDKQKEQVSNYGTLLTARDRLDTLIEESKKLNENEIMAYNSIIYLKDYLRNPDSFQVHTIQVSEYGIMCAIEYSAQNGFGGSVRDIFITYYSVIKDQFEEDIYINQDSLLDLWHYEIEKDGDKIENIDVARVMAAFDDPSILS